MHRSRFNTSSRVAVAICMAVAMVLGLMGTALPPVLGKPGLQQTCQGDTCITIKSGNGNESVCPNMPSLDPQVEVSTDGMNWSPAFIVAPNSDLPEFTYDIIPGTHYVSVSCDRSAAANSHFFFRTTFVLPAGAVDPCISVKIHSDNATTVFLNGNQFGAQPDVEDPANFKDPVDVFTTNNSAFFVNGSNTLSFDVHNFTNQMALDFEATICSSQGCVDEDPPAISCNVAETQLWPPNHNLENVGLTASVTDDCDTNIEIGGGPTGNGVAVYSDEPDLDITGSGNFSPDAKNVGLNTLRLRSERSGNENGRVYLIVVQATDMAGNTGFCVRTVTVPHDQSKASKNSVTAQAAAARAFFLANQTPPPGFVQVGVGPIVGPKQ
ncbi:MAG TPA: beta galactosidase jelly roll domain-containing protein [Blastocatellia bacterium]|nr:beta galactosidase jelly roll domain-containing protein [Blastocatellia bacterium]